MIFPAKQATEACSILDPIRFRPAKKPNLIFHNLDLFTRNRPKGIMFMQPIDPFLASEFCKTSWESAYIF